jgi:hypothetical protein
MMIINSLDVLGLLDGIYVKIDSSLAIKLLHVFFRSAYILLFRLGNRAGSADSESSAIQFPSKCLAGSLTHIFIHVSQ